MPLISSYNIFKFDEILCLLYTGYFIMLFCPSCFFLARQNLSCARALNYVLKWRLLELVAHIWLHLSLLNTRINSVVVHFVTVREVVTHFLAKQSPKGTKENRKENLRLYFKSRKDKRVKKTDLRCLIQILTTFINGGAFCYSFVFMSIRPTSLAFV